MGTQPGAALDGLCGTSTDELKRGIRLLRDGLGHGRPLFFVPDNELLSWCDQDPQARYPALAKVITFHAKEEKQLPHWTSIAHNFLKKAPDPSEILQQFTARFAARGFWTNTTAPLLESMATLLDQPDDYPHLQETVKEQRQTVAQWIDEAKQRSKAWQERHDERFE